MLTYLNRAPVQWLSKQQNSIETSSFGSEFCALKVAAEMNRGLRYKLRMMGVPLLGPANVRCDNMSVVYNTMMPESTLKKKSNSIAYHFVRECVAAEEMRIGWEDTRTNLGDVLTKIQLGTKRNELVKRILW